MKKKPSNSPRIGRPPKPEHEKYKTKVRQLGRVDDETWARLKKAAADAGMYFTEWALGVLNAAANNSKK